MSPIIPVGVAVIVLAAMLSKKSAKAGQTEGLKDQTEAGRVYQQAMDPSMRDLTWMRQAVAFLNAQGATELAQGVSARIAALQADANAERAAQEAAERARQQWEQQNGGAPTQAQLDAVWAKVQSGEIERDPNGKALATYAWTLFVTYGTPARATVAKALMDRLSGVLQVTPSPPPVATQPPVVVVRDNNTGTTVPVAPPPEPPAAPPPVTAAPPAAPPPVTAPPPEPRYTTMPVEPPGPPDVIVAPPPAAPPVAGREVEPAADPHGTIALARDMIAVEETRGWKTALAGPIKAWQGRMGLVQDAKFGPKGAIVMAREVGVLPLIRYWPKGSVLSTALPAYRDELYTTAANLDQAGRPEHAAALRVSAEHETGQGYPSAPAAVPASTRVAQATKVAAAVGAVGSGNLSLIRTDLMGYTPSPTGRGDTSDADAAARAAEEQRAWEERLQVGRYAPGGSLANQ